MKPKNEIAYGVPQTEHEIERTNKATVKALEEVEKEIKELTDRTYPEDIFGKRGKEKEGKEFIKGFSVACNLINRDIIQYKIEEYKNK